MAYLIQLAPSPPNLPKSVLILATSSIALLTDDPRRSVHVPRHVVDLEWTGGRYVTPLSPPPGVDPAAARAADLSPDSSSNYKIDLSRSRREIGKDRIEQSGRRVNDERVSLLGSRLRRIWWMEEMLLSCENGRREHFVIIILAFESQTKIT